jgi:hypothetical protein
MATSGRRAGMRAMAWATVPASPTTSRSSSVSSSWAIPRRTISWSSSRKTEIVTVRASRQGPVETDATPG